MRCKKHRIVLGILLGILLLAGCAKKTTNQDLLALRTTAKELSVDSPLLKALDWKGHEISSVKLEEKTSRFAFMLTKDAIDPKEGEDLARSLAKLLLLTKGLDWIDISDDKGHGAWMTRKVLAQLPSLKDDGGTPKTEEQLLTALDEAETFPFEFPVEASVYTIVMKPSAYDFCE